jgi:SRSO17 transposase
MGQQHLPGEEAWLIGERRSNGERKYYLSNLPADTSLKRLAGAIKARWICEQAHQQTWSWPLRGKIMHRHALMTIIAYPFLQSRRIKQAKQEKRIQGPPPQPTLPAIRAAIIAARTATANAMSALPTPAQSKKCAKVVLCPVVTLLCRPRSPA